MRTLYYILLFNFLFTNLLYGQVDTFSLPLIEISADPLNALSVATTINPEKNWAVSPWTNLADLNRLNAFTFINQYSANGLASPNYRGLGFERTQLNWNGLILNSPANGGMDYQLISRVAGRDWNFYSGGHSALAGSGALGGVIDIQENWNSKNQLYNQIALSINHFGDFEEKVSLLIKKQKSQHSLKLAGSQNADQYNYREGQRKNTKAQSYHLLQNNFWKFKKQALSTHLWLNQSERKIPPSIGADYFGDKQFDTNLRAVVNHQYNAASGIFKNTVGGLRERISYTNDFIRTKPTIVYRAQYNGSYQNTSAAGWKQIAMINANLDWSDSYQDKVTSFTTFAAAYTLAKRWGLHQASFSVRQNIRLEGDHPLTGFAKYERKGKIVTIGIRASRDFRQPTLNDLYWRGGQEAGNPELRSESSWGQEISLNFKLINSNTTKLSWNNQFFSMIVDDWIQWQFESIWQPQNIKKVWTRGYTTQFEYFKKWNDLYFNLTLSGTFNPVSEWRADKKGSLFSRQLIRSPLEIAQGSFLLQKDKWRFSYTHQYTGERKMTTDGSSILPFFTTGNFQLDYFATKHWAFSAQVENSWNAPVFYLPGQPLPGRAFQFNAAFSF